MSFFLEDPDIALHFGVGIGIEYFFNSVFSIEQSRNVFLS